MQTFFDYLGVSGLGVVVLSLIIEISPIKLNPISYLGKLLNKEILDTTKRTEKKLDEHIAQSYRNKILDFQDRILRGGSFTLEEWNEVLSACDAYEKYVAENSLVNGKANLAIEFIKHKYKMCLDNSEFLNLGQDLLQAALLLNKKEENK